MMPYKFYGNPANRSWADLEQPQSFGEAGLGASNALNKAWCARAE
jgi:hypothetical protein